MYPLCIYINSDKVRLWELVASKIKATHSLTGSEWGWECCWNICLKINGSRDWFYRNVRLYKMDTWRETRDERIRNKSWATWGVNGELLIIKIDCFERHFVSANLQGLRDRNVHLLFVFCVFFIFEYLS